MPSYEILGMTFTETISSIVNDVWLTLTTQSIRWFHIDNDDNCSKLECHREDALHQLTSFRRSYFCCHIHLNLTQTIKAMRIIGNLVRY